MEVDNIALSLKILAVFNHFGWLIFLLNRKQTISRAYAVDRISFFFLFI